MFDRCYLVGKGVLGIFSMSNYCFVQYDCLCVSPSMLSMWIVNRATSNPVSRVVDLYNNNNNSSQLLLLSFHIGQILILIVNNVVPLRSPFNKPMLLSTDASAELFELHSLLDGGKPTFPRSATPSGSLKCSRCVATVMCFKLLRCSFSGPAPYLDDWPLCKLVDCCIRSRRKISSSESELV